MFCYRTITSFNDNDFRYSEGGLTERLNTTEHSLTALCWRAQRVCVGTRFNKQTNKKHKLYNEKVGAIHY